MRRDNDFSDRKLGRAPLSVSEKSLSQALSRIAKVVEVPDGYIKLSGPLEHDNIVNGDGLRAVLWTQGCPNHCKGCQNPETWDYDDGHLVKLEDIKKELASFNGQAGLTFCGGEPFVQPKACKEIADYVRKELGWDVWSFSGFTHEIIKEAGGEAWEFLKSLDVLIDGPFILSQRDLSLRFRGSKNQRLLRLERGTAKILATE
ncbi:anaerobic ribonucleoside-triphosphate reductase activating protein [Candidatus Saccharibacteria bacterium]|nr:anaerobic ribonucleoside-triphosphate reductase activating protein [Candidatus Saccharibacteria bacterium]